MRFNLVLLFVIVAVFGGGSVLGQSPNASISGVVLDPDKRSIAEAEILVVNDFTRVQYEAKSNAEGFFAVTNLPPGQYRIQVSKVGFKAIIKPDIILNVQEALAITFTLPMGASSVVVTVEGGAPMINTTDATVSTVVDRQFAENLPLNGRSFQTLIQLTPGVVLTPSTSNEGGQFSVNGQRAESNYWMVDGVSANIGMSSVAQTGNSFGGALGSFSALGGTNSLVSVDALQEFRIQTSTYAPEFGRTPGGQISILTRSGTNLFHGTLFDYFRNDILDANNWFNTSVTPALPKAKERQNDFGGTFSGPILKDRTFFFFSYEGLRLRLPQTTLTTVPDLAARQNAVSAIQPYLNAYPIPNGPEVLASGNPTGGAQFNASYSNPGTLDAYSLRIDHRLSNNLNFFARYNYSPSEFDQRGGGAIALTTVALSRVTTQTATVGVTSSLSASVTNDFRFNYSRTNSTSRFDQDNFGGAVPLSSPGFPSPFTSQNAELTFYIFGFNNGNALSAGQGAKNLQRQVNVVDGLSWQKGSHSLKFGIDFRRLSPLNEPFSYQQIAFFFGVPSAESGNPAESEVLSGRNAAILLRNLGGFGQDTWRLKPRLTVTYGLRWDVDFAPSPSSGPNLLAITGYNLRDLSHLALAPAETSPFETRYGNLAPRLGLAYQVSQSQEWQTVLRGGFGVFYDMATSQAGNAFLTDAYPFGARTNIFGSSFPLSPAAAAPPPIVPPNASNGQILTAFDPHLRLPYTLEWNVAIEQALGKQQTISASYVGAAGRRLLQAADILTPNPNLAEAILYGNTATSDYNALQLRFDRRLSHGLQAIASYTWSHSLDDGSEGALGSSNLSPTLNSNANRGPSDFDIRNAFSAGVTYDVPAPRMNRIASVVLHGWSLQTLVQARSAQPVDVFDLAFQQLSQAAGQAVIRPDVVPGQSLYLFGAQCIAVFAPLPCAGGKGFNPAAFQDPPIDLTTGLPLRQGNLGRNALRGLGATQWDFGVHRDFPIHESLKLQFRAEMFNVLNHPNFGPPSGSFLSPQNGGPGGFGVSTQMLGQYFNGGTSGAGNVGGGALSPLYQIGGPRSIQLALKLLF